MSVKMDWLVPGQVIYQRWWGVGTLDDMRRVNQTTLDMFSQHPDRAFIHCVANAIGQERAEGGISQIRQTYTVLDHPQTGWILIVVDKPLLRITGNIALQIGRPQSRLRFINSVNDWQSTLIQHDPTIDWDTLDLSVIERLERNVM